MKTTEKIQNRIDKWSEGVSQYLARLSPRERIMVIFTTILLLVVTIGWSLWMMHHVAEKQQKRVNDLKDLVVWMQSNVVTMKPADDQALSNAEKVQRAAQQQGLAVTSQAVGEQLQIVAQHQNYAILANFLTQLAQMGLSVEKMELIKADQQIKLTATIQ